ncbi:hypothetical protein F1847_00420 [Thermodesulfobacterium sp. TA1]|uniref:Rossmann-like domain-containing protein n=1 Tax=Thermodesulfobacterium sp. TA1 TaxID=2234087 RepID=UPI0012324C4D|nr:DUF364 domain-containing protein [Thermodesulfobacterium sp. TA1]QER41274.1 hypothetical protein F1847_00420 [Thermodesulfobacterium sp. TA1]
MGIYTELVEKAIPYSRAKKIKRMVLGIHYTMVEVERLGAGLAYTLLPEIKSCCELNDSINFWKMPADIAIKGYLSNNQVEVIVGLATINAVLSSKKENFKNSLEGDLFLELKLGYRDEVLMIGRFDPVIRKLQGRVKKIWVLEKEEDMKSFSVADIKDRLKLVIITSSTLVNKTLEDCLESLYGVPEVVLMGPSTPLCPEVFRFTPITWLCGAVVKDPDQLFTKICEGKGAQAFFKAVGPKPILEKINLRVKK